MKKLTKTAKTLDTVFKILFWLVLAAGILICAVFAIFLIMTLTGKEIGPVLNGLDIGFISFQLSEGDFPAPRNAVIMHICAMVGLAVGIALVCCWIKIIRKILAPMTQGQPFHSAVSTNLKKLGWVELIGGIVIVAAELAGNLLMVRSYDLQHLFLNDRITDVHFNYELDITFVIISAVLFLLSYIFRYGSELQQLSDETL